MRSIVLGVAAACMCFAPIGVEAQVLTSTGGVALLPSSETESIVSRPVVLPGTAGSGRDLFLAGPDTYTPRVDRQHPVFRSGYFLQSGIGYVQRGHGEPRGRHAHQGPSNRIRPETARGRAANASRSTGTAERKPGREPLPMPAGPEKTFYVIPQCYAGDVLPRAEQLSTGCDLADLRVLPSRGRR